MRGRWADTSTAGFVVPQQAHEVASFRRTTPGRPRHAGEAVGVEPGDVTAVLREAEPFGVDEVRHPLPVQQVEVVPRHRLAAGLVRRAEGN